MGRGVLPFAALVGKDKEVTTVFHELLEVLEFVGREGLLGRSNHEEVSPLDLLEVDHILVESDLHGGESTLCVSLYFFTNFFRFDPGFPISCFPVSKMIYLAEDLPPFDCSLFKLI